MYLHSFFWECKRGSLIRPKTYLPYISKDVVVIELHLMKDFSKLHQPLATLLQQPLRSGLHYKNSLGFQSSLHRASETLSGESLCYRQETILQRESEFAGGDSVRPQWECRQTGKADFQASRSHAAAQPRARQRGQEGPGGWS